MPFQTPENCASICSVTSIVPSAFTFTSASKRAMVSVRALSGATVANRAHANNNSDGKRRTIPATRTLGRFCVKADFGCFPLPGVFQLEELAFFEAKHPGDDVGGHLLDLGIEVAYHGIVIPSRVLKSLFQIRQR